MTEAALYIKHACVAYMYTVGCSNAENSALLSVREQGKERSREVDISERDKHFCKISSLGTWQSYQKFKLHDIFQHKVQPRLSQPAGTTPTVPIIESSDN